MTESLPQPIQAPLSRAQRAQVLNLLRRTARAEILPRFRALDASQIDTKSGPQDLVTDADREAEKMITRGLLAMFPHARIIGEEAVSADPSRLDGLAEAELAFTVDPVDGTWNFAHGLATFGVILSMLRFGRPVFAALYDPILDDFVLAEENGPCHMTGLQRRDRVLRTSAGGRPEDLTGYIALSQGFGAHLDQVAATLPKLARHATLRCACHEFRMLAQGHVDFVLTTGLTPWDHAAGVLAVQRAGGHATLLDGSDYRADAPRGAVLLAAANAETWAHLRDLYGFLLAD